MLVVLLPLSLTIKDSEFDHGGGDGGGGSPAAVVAAEVAAMDDDWRQKRPARRALTVT